MSQLYAGAFTRRDFLAHSTGMAAAWMLAGKAAPGGPALTAGELSGPAEATTTRPNVLVVVLDSLRADHVGSYGYRRPTTPFLDLLAREGVVFEQTYSQSSYTRQSVSSILTGRNPSECGAFGWTAKPQHGMTLGEVFAPAGYRTGLFTNTSMLEDPAFHRGFDTFKSVNQVWNESGRGPVLSDAAASFAAEDPAKPFFMYVHYLDPHGPYAPPRSFYARFADRINPEPLQINRDLRVNLPAMRANGFGPGAYPFDDLVNRYDAEIAHSDYAVGVLFDALERSGQLDNTIVAVVADHGEEFLEHGFFEHAWLLYREHLQVPMILWAPGRLRPSRLPAPVPLLGLAPTLARLAGLDTAQAGYSAEPLLECVGTDWVPRLHAGPMLAELTIQSRSVHRTMTDGPWKYLAAQKWIPPASFPDYVKQSAGPEADESRADLPRVDVFGPIVYEELYNLEQDPNEQRNIVDAEGSVRDQLRGQMEAYFAQCRALAGSSVDPAAISDEERERLDAMGYLN